MVRLLVPGPRIVALEVMKGSADARLIVPFTAKVMLLEQSQALMLSMAARSEPAPLSASVVT